MPPSRPHRPPEPQVLDRVWGRLSPRFRASAQAGQTVVTVRAGAMACQQLPGAEIRCLYEAAGDTRRQGEAERLRLLDLAPGAQLRLPLRPGATGLWLALSGSARVGGQALRRLEAWQSPCEDQVTIATRRGARLLLREDAHPDPDGAQRWSARPCMGGAWSQPHKGVSCWMLGPRGRPGPYLLRLSPGCEVPVHRHLSDEECLMLAGDMYVDDQLLLAGDYQVAKAGGVHRLIQTDQGALVLVHGNPEPERLSPAEL